MFPRKCFSFHFEIAEYFLLFFWSPPHALFIWYRIRNYENNPKIVVAFIPFFEQVNLLLFLSSHIDKMHNTITDCPQDLSITEFIVLIIYLQMISWLSLHYYYYYYYHYYRDYYNYYNGISDYLIVLSYLCVGQKVWCEQIVLFWDSVDLTSSRWIESKKSLQSPRYDMTADTVQQSTVLYSTRQYSVVQHSTHTYDNVQDIMTLFIPFLQNTCGSLQWKTRDVQYNIEMSSFSHSHFILVFWNNSHWFIPLFVHPPFVCNLYCIFIYWSLPSSLITSLPFLFYLPIFL